jgi:hypothetical protein
MNINVNEVYSFKLSSGEELISKVLRVTDDYLYLSNPVSVAPGPNGIGLVPSMFTAENDEEVRLNTNTVTLVAQTEDNVKMKYLEALTGIKVPSKKLILG